MCGIAGFCLTATSTIDTNILAKVLLEGIEHRGKDATGMAWWKNPNQPSEAELWLYKTPELATTFVKDMPDISGTTSCILHTRAATTGSPQDTKNNHPIHTGNIVGVHNGIVSNDDELFRKLGTDVTRHGQVDSEAIFAAIAHGTERHKGKPRISENLMKILETIEGSAAIAWLQTHHDPNANPYELRLARLKTNPIAWCQTEDGSFVFASESTALHKALNAVGQQIVGKVEYADEGTYMRIHCGRVADVSKFTVKTYGSYSGSGSYGGTTTVTRSYHNADYGHNGRWIDSDDVRKTLATVLDVDYATVIKPYTVRNHEAEYPKRVRAITEFLKEYKVEDEDSIVGYVHLAPARRGDFVYTYIQLPNGEFQQVMGQIWVMPETFPEGKYYIKVWWQTGTKDEKPVYEEALVARVYDEIDLIPANKPKDEPTKANTPTETAQDPKDEGEVSNDPEQTEDETIPGMSNADEATIAAEFDAMMAEYGGAF